MGTTHHYHTQTRTIVEKQKSSGCPYHGVAGWIFIAGGYNGCSSCYYKMQQDIQQRNKLTNSLKQKQQEFKLKQTQLSKIKEQFNAKTLDDERQKNIMQKEIEMTHFTVDSLKDLCANKEKIRKAGMQNGVFKMTVTMTSDEKKAFAQNQPRGLSTEQYQKRRKQNPNILYGRASLEEFPRTEQQAKEKVSDQPDMKIQFPLTQEAKQKLQQPNLMLPKKDFKSFMQFMDED